MSEYQKKIDFAIKLLRSIPQDGPIELCYSTGKDSDVILELSKMADIPCIPIYKNTTCDRPGSIAHAREMGVEIRQPKYNLLELINSNGWPSRYGRFCCRILKEYKIHDRAIVGIRRSESPKRAKRYKEPEVCRIYGKNKKTRQYLPILDWEDEDVARFVAERGLRCHPHYYDGNGEFQVERRVGCIGCPLQSDNGKSDFKEFPQILRARARAYKKWWDAHPATKTASMFPDIYHALFMKLFFVNMTDYELEVNKRGLLFNDQNIEPQPFLENYFNIDLTF